MWLNILHLTVLYSWVALYDYYRNAHPPSSLLYQFLDTIQLFLDGINFSLLETLVDLYKCKCRPTGIPIDQTLKFTSRSLEYTSLKLRYVLRLPAPYFVDIYFSWIFVLVNFLVFINIFGLYQSSVGIYHILYAQRIILFLILIYFNIIQIVLLRIFKYTVVLFLNEWTASLFFIFRIHFSVYKG